MNAQTVWSSCTHTVTNACRQDYRSSSTVLSSLSLYCLVAAHSSGNSDWALGSKFSEVAGILNCQPGSHEFKSNRSTIWPQASHYQPQPATFCRQCKSNNINLTAKIMGTTWPSRQRWKFCSVMKLTGWPPLSLTQLHSIVGKIRPLAHNQEFLW